MRSLRLVSLCPLLKRFSSFANEPYHHPLCKFSYCGPPCSSFWAGNDPTDFAAALSLSENSMSFTLGTQVHGHVIKLGFSEDIFSQNNLIKMYKKFGVLDDGFKVFNEMPYRNIVSWTLMISGAIQLGCFEVGVEIFMEMTRTGLVPNEFALGSIMKACTSMGASDFGSCVHCFALKIGLEINPFVGCSILNFYAKLGDIVAGERIFDGLNYVDIGCWNSLIGAYAQCGYGLEALNIVSSMRWKRITMDKFTFVNVLQGCTDLGDTDIGKQIHGLILRSEMEFDTSVMNALMDMYFQNGGRDSAWKVFRRMLNKDVVSWNTVFGGASQYEDPGEVARLYHEFIGTGMRPNFFTFSGLFRQCAQLSDLNLGLQLFCHALCFGFFNESTVVCSLINMFSRCEKMEMACLVFESKLLTDITPWNELISGHNLNYHESEALHIFCKLWELGVEANEFTFCSILESCYRYEDRKMCRQIHAALIKSGFAHHGYVCNSLVECYIKLGLLYDSSKLFCSLEKLDIACWGTMVSALVRQGYNCEAIRFLRFMIGVGEKPDEFVMGSIFNSCAEIAAYQQTICVHPFAIKIGYDANVFVASAVIDAYAKCGDIGSARMAFDQSYHSNDLITYNTMIMAYARNGLVSEAMDIFETMKSANLQPSQATFVSLLSACGHRGLVDQGRLLFESMHLKYGLVPSPENYGCFVDMLSRNGYLEEAKRIIEVMPFPPWPAICRSLLSGCRIHGNRKLGEWGAKKLLELVPKNNAAYILLTKVYSERSSWEDVEKVQRIMMERRVSKDAGCSWIET